jgi:peptidoglycan LD-endopeptidase LytH
VKYSIIILALSLLSPFFLSTSSTDAVQTVTSPVVLKHTADVEKSASDRFNQFNSLIRDNRIRKSDAIQQLEPLLSDLRSEYYRRGGEDYSRKDWVFPLSGYSEKSITGGRKKGYIPSGYDYFTGNRHGGHPSFDIFIRDRNQDGIEDKSGRQVNVLSMTGGIVVALEDKWERNSRLRGGLYLWIYDPANSLLVYYAHNSTIAVKLGDIVKPGDQLATVGRSGLNAAKRRSPTHLHLTVLEIRNGRPLPLNVYPDLVASKKM